RALRAAAIAALRAAAVADAARELLRLRGRLLLGGHVLLLLGGVVLLPCRLLLLLARLGGRLRVGGFRRRGNRPGRCGRGGRGRGRGGRRHRRRRGDDVASAGVVLRDEVTVCSRCRCRGGGAIGRGR